MLQKFALTISPIADGQIQIVDENCGLCFQFRHPKGVAIVQSALRAARLRRLTCWPSACVDSEDGSASSAEFTGVAAQGHKVVYSPGEGTEGPEGVRPSIRNDEKWKLFLETPVGRAERVCQRWPASSES